jgi:hypothetical protein
MSHVTCKCLPYSFMQYYASAFSYDGVGDKLWLIYPLETTLSFCYIDASKNGPQSCVAELSGGYGYENDVSAFDAEGRTIYVQAQLNDGNFLIAFNVDTHVVAVRTCPTGRSR